MEMQPPKHPSPWLGPILSATALGFFILWAYLQMRHWREPEADYVAIAINIVVTGVLWAILLYGSWRVYRRTPNQSGEELPANKLTKGHAGTLTIHSAQWISVERGLSKPVERFVREQIKETIVDSASFQLKKATLGGEIPGAKDTPKTLRLSYSYGDSNPREITKDEYDWLILPEPPIEHVESQSKTPSDEELIRAAPRVFIEYKHDPNKGDVLMARNDQHADASNLSFDPIRATVTHPINPKAGIPPVVGGGPTVEILVNVHSGIVNQDKPLYAVLGDDSTNCKETVTIYYEGAGQKHFSRDFTLKQEMQKVTWEPGPVRLVKPQVEIGGSETS